MPSFNECLHRTLQFERGYSNHVSDRGGPTRWGITKDTAQLVHYGGDMRNFPFCKATLLYELYYWDNTKCKDIDLINPKFTFQYFDSCVLHGDVKAARMLQECINLAFNLSSLHNRISVDGIVGDKTIDSLSLLHLASIKYSFPLMYFTLRVNFINDLVKSDKDLLLFYGGWLERASKVLEFSLKD